jgi:catechol 2,3-dioxygenase-like lactoylglutathione lyase family enzyme
VLAAYACACTLRAEVHVVRVGCPVVSTASLERSVAFYRDALTFQLAGTSGPAGARTAHLKLGAECLDLTEYHSPEGKPFFSDSNANDLWFEHIAIVVSDMAAAFDLLRAHHARFVSNMPQMIPEWNRNAAGISARYFRDPDGHYLELIHYPPGKGRPKWQARSGQLFLGIDHTAIAVADTDRSVRFYRDRLGLQMTGTGENYGVEQERRFQCARPHHEFAGECGDRD